MFESDNLSFGKAAKADNVHWIGLVRNQNPTIQTISSIDSITLRPIPNARLPFTIHFNDSAYIPAIILAPKYFEISVSRIIVLNK